jgi:hypothetical protein
MYSSIQMNTNDIEVFELTTPLEGKSTGEYKANFKEKPNLYGLGISMHQAVAMLVLTHQVEMGIKIDYVGQRKLDP